MSQISADLILHNGLLWTGDANCPQAEALAVHNGRIAAVGSSQEILDRYTAPDAMCIDLQGQRLIPGLHDTHMHLLSTGIMLEEVQLTGCSSISEMVQRFRKASPKNGWLIGRGFLHNLFEEQRMPTRRDLDLVSTDYPVYAVRACGHITVCNSKLLEMAGISKGFGQVEGGEIGYDANGEPNGILAERASGLVRHLLPPSTEESMQQAIAKASKEMIRIGLTTVHSDDLGNDGWDRTHAAYSAAFRAGDMKLRLNHQLRFDKPEDVARFVAWREASAPTYGMDPERFQYGPVKLMCDGSLGGRTAAMCEPYADAPDTTGVAILSRQQMVAILDAAHTAGFQLSGHAIGDKAITDLIEAMAEVIPPADRSAARPRVIHAQITTPEILTRMRELHVHCDIQPAFVATDQLVAAARVGEAKAQTSYAWATMRRMGITTSGGSDSPVETFNPFFGIYCAVTRCTAEGNPEDGWNPSERLTVEDALCLYTSDAASIAGNKDVVGQLSPGQYADFILLDRDILNIPAAEIKDIQVCASWINGELVYRADS